MKAGPREAVAALLLFVVWYLFVPWGPQAEIASWLHAPVAPLLGLIGGNWPAVAGISVAVFIIAWRADVAAQKRRL